MAPHAKHTCFLAAFGLFGSLVLGAGAQALELKRGASPSEMREFAHHLKASYGRVIVRVKDVDARESQILDLSRATPQDLLEAVKTTSERVRARQRGLRNLLTRRHHALGPSVEIAPIVISALTGGAVGQAQSEESFDSALEFELNGLLSQDGIEAIEADSLSEPLAQSTPWGITKINAPSAWNLAQTKIKGAGVKVAVMDSGGTPSHADLNYAGGYNPMTSSTAQAEWLDSISQCNGHGTHVAGTVAALDNDVGVVGVAPEVQLYAIKVFEIINNSCLAWASSQIGGLNWAVTQGIRVVNVSIGGGSGLGSYGIAVQNAAAAGTFVVASSGNNGNDSILYPAKYADAISVGGTTSSDARASWSNYGPALDVVAPGASISSTMPSGGYGSKSGTSMASPHVAGLVALMVQVKPNITIGEIRSTFAASSVDLGVAGRDDYFGSGRINAEAAVALLQGQGPPPALDPSLSLAEEDLIYGGGRITAGDRTVLDQRGNNNGQYDLGDLLALKRRS